MSPTLLLILYGLAVAGVSFIGGWGPIRFALTHRRMQLVLSAVAGFMLGVALLHLLPHAAETASIHHVAQIMLAGFLAMFLVERFFAFHDHEPPEACADHAHEHATSHVHDHEHTHEHEPHEHAPHLHGHSMLNRRGGWTGVAIGMALHSLIGGIALGSAVLADAQRGAVLAGMAVFLGVVLHKPLDAVTVLTVARSSGMSRKSAMLLNLAFACVVPVGALLAYFGLDAATAESSPLVAYALAFSAGTFLCVALSDLLPELHFHDHDRLPLTFALLLGIALAWGVESIAHVEHDHGAHAVPDAQHDDHEAAHDDHDHDHHDHNH